MPSLTRLTAAAAGAAASLALAAPAFAQEPGDPPAPQIIPEVSCVERQADTAEARFKAHFGYTNLLEEDITIDQGPDNVVDVGTGPETEPRGTPEGQSHPAGTRFASGVHASVFYPEFDGVATWRVTYDRAFAEDTATAAYAQRCVWADATAGVTTSSAQVAWNFTLSGEGQDGFGVPGWDDFRERTCFLDDMEKPLPAAICEGARPTTTAEGGAVAHTFEGLKPGSTHTFRVVARAPKLCTEAGEDACLGVYDDKGAFDPTYQQGAADSAQTRSASVTFTVATPEVPKTEPTPQPQPTPVAPQPQPQPTPVAPQPQPRPVVPPVTQQQPNVDRPCPKRSVRITVPTKRKLKIRSATVRVDGRKLAVKRRSGRHVATLPASAITADSVTVTIKVRYSNGSRRTLTRVISTCA